MQVRLEPRAQRAAHQIKLIHASAKSMRISSDDVNDLLVEHALLSEATLSTEVTEDSPSTASKPGAGHWSRALDMARTIPLEEAVDVLSVIASRIDQELFERKEK